MRIRLQKGGPVIGSPSQVMNDFSSATEARQAEWEQRLTESPAAFRGIEQEIKQHFDRGADHRRVLCWLASRKARKWNST